jgi:hypothetical protein
LSPLDAHDIDPSKRIKPQLTHLVRKRHRTPVSAVASRAAAMQRDALETEDPALGQGGWELIPGFTVEHATLALLVPAAPLFEEKCRT